MIRIRGVVHDGASVAVNIARIEGIDAGPYLFGTSEKISMLLNNRVNKNK